MPLKTLVKVGSLTNLSDARYCAGMDVQLLGFQTIPEAPAHITPARYQEIRGWISGPSIVAEVHGARTRDQIDAIVEAYRPDFVELGLAEMPLVAHLSLPLILRLEPHEALAMNPHPDYVLTDVTDERTFDVPAIVKVSSEAEAETVLQRKNVKGIALQGGEEMSPGLKTYDSLAPILESLEEY